MRSLGGTDDSFLAVYPEANTMRVSDLLGAIRGKHGRRRKSQNGTPEQRDSSPSTALATSTRASDIEDLDADGCM